MNLRELQGLREEIEAVYFNRLRLGNSNAESEHITQLYVYLFQLVNHAIQQSGKKNPPDAKKRQAKPKLSNAVRGNGRKPSRQVAERSPNR